MKFYTRHKKNIERAKTIEGRERKRKEERRANENGELRETRDSGKKATIKKAAAVTKLIMAVFFNSY